MADTIILMDKGRIMQMAPPEVIYLEPENAFTAQFIGTPPMNILKLGGDGRSFGFRPEKGILSHERREGCAYCVPGRISTREMMGSETIYKVAVNSGVGDTGSVMIKSQDYGFRIDDRIWITVEDEFLYFFDRDGIRLRPGDRREKAALFAQVEKEAAHG